MPNRINEKIRGVSEVRLVGDNVEQGIYTYQEAIRIADDLNLDLVEVSPNAVPPVCRVIDYQKFLYQKKRKEKEQKQRKEPPYFPEHRWPRYWYGCRTPEADRQCWKNGLHWQRSPQYPQFLV